MIGPGWIKLLMMLQKGVSRFGWKHHMVIQFTKAAAIKI